MKAQIDIDVDTEQVHTVVGVAAIVHIVIWAYALPQGETTDVFADAGYQGVESRPGARRQLRFCRSETAPQVAPVLYGALHLGVCRKLDPSTTDREIW